MKVSLEWLCQYAPAAADAADVCERMMHIGNEVEELSFPHAGIEKIVAARVTDIARHPDADTLWVCHADNGTETVQVVTGAQNVHQNDIVPLCMVGAKLPSGMVIKASKLRGVESHGMLTGGAELGITNAHYPNAEVDGILILDPDTPLGTDVCTLVGLDSPIFDFKPLANRPDCMSVMGLAGEMAAAYGLPLNKPEAALPENLAAPVAKVEVLAPALCTQYTAQLVRGVTVGPSPLWMRHRLLAAGIRPINTVVDITNYVMLEMGQPLHAFDLAQLASPHIIVRRAREDETLTLLDGTEQKLLPSHLVICDETGPVALAGVMGGERSGISENTRDVLIESAIFAPTCVRATSRALGVRSESSARYEKGVDPTGAAPAATRAATLMVELCGGKIVEAPTRVCLTEVEPQILVADCDKITALLGVDISPETQCQHLNTLHLPCVLKDNRLHVTIPPARCEIQHHADLAEEIMRLHGYEHIPSTSLSGELRVGGYSAERTWRDRVTDMLCGLGLHQAMNYSFIGPSDFEAARLDKTPLSLQNPLGMELSQMRTSLLPGLLKNLAYNDAHRNPVTRLFEVDKVFLAQSECAEPSGQPEAVPTFSLDQPGVAPTFSPGQPDAAPAFLPNEPWRLGLCGQGNMDFYTLKGWVQAVCDRLDVPATYARAEHALFHPGRSAVLMLKDKNVGIFGELHPAVARELGLRNRAYLAELHLEDLVNAPKPDLRYAPMPRTPALTRDLALVMPEQTPVGDIITALRRAGGSRLESLDVFDVYRGAPLAQDEKSVAFSLIWRDENQTLSDTDITKPMGKLLAAAQALGARLRS